MAFVVNAGTRWGFPEALVLVAVLLWFKVAVLVFQTTRKLTRSVACGRNRRDLQVVFTSLDDAVCICFCTGMTPSVCAVLFAWWRVLSHPVRCGCFRCDVRETGSFFFPQGVHCTDSVSSRRVLLLLLLLSLSLPLSLFLRAVVSFFFASVMKKKRTLCGDFGRDGVTALVRF